MVGAPDQSAAMVSLTLGERSGIVLEVRPFGATVFRLLVTGGDGLQLSAWRLCRTTVWSEHSSPIATRR